MPSNRSQRKTAAREYSRPPRAAPQNAASREASPGVFATYGSRFGQIAFALLWLLLFLSPYAFSGFAPATQDDFAPPAPFGPLTGQSLFCAFTALAAFFVALVPRTFREYSRVQKIAVFGMCAFFALLCASVFVASYQYDALLEIVRVACIVVWFFLARAITLCEIDDQNFARVLANRLGALLLAISLGAALVAALALRDFFASGAMRQASTFYNNNLLANYCAMAVPLCLSLAIHALRRARNAAGETHFPILVFVAFACFFVTLAGLLVTASKGGFLSLLVALFVFAAALFLARRAALLRFVRARKLLVACVAAFIVLGGGAVASRTVVPRLLAARTTDDNSTMFRVFTWRGTAKMAQQKPLLGWGAGAFPSTYSTRFGETGYTRSAHQSWLQIAAEGGVPALLALLAALGAACACGARALRGATWETSAGAIAALAALLAHGFVDSGWNITSIALLAMICAAMLLAGETATGNAPLAAFDSIDSFSDAASTSDASTRAAPLFNFAARADKPHDSAKTSRQNKDANSDATSVAARDASRKSVAAVQANASTREAPGGNIAWNWMACALLVAGAAWWMQRVVSANDAIREDRARLAQQEIPEGGIEGALQRSAQAVELNPLAAPLHLHRARLLEGAGKNALSSYQTAAQLRSENAEGWRALAEYLVRRKQNELPAELFARAVSLDPKNTGLLLDFANFRLQRGDARGYDSLRAIVALRQSPYGRYPALADFVNLDFARAALLLAPRETDKNRRDALLQMAQRDLELARTKQDFVTRLAAENYGTSSIEAPQDLEELESELKKLREN